MSASLLPPDPWAQSEFGFAQLGDQRRNQRLVNIAEHLAADDADAVFIHATVCDADDNPVPGATNAVTLTVRGPARWVGPSAAWAEAGVATTLLGSSGFRKGKISVTATAAGLSSAYLNLKPGK